MNLREQALRGHDRNARADTVQRKCACSGSCSSCDKKKKIQRRALGDTIPELPSSVTRVLHDPGTPLDGSTRAMMEGRFGRSFADVRVHTDTHAAASAAAIDAAAYTAGTHIVFGSHRYEPHTMEGRRLLAHELAHVVQQRNGTALPEGVGPADDPHEREADRVADAVVAQGPAFTPPVIAPATQSLIRREVEEDHREPERQPLIVADSATPAPSQMRRAEFVEQLDTAICATADQEMARLGQSTRGCPLLERWRPRIRAMDARTLEISLRRWSGLDHARSAQDYIPAVTRRLAQSIALWGATGRITGVDPDLLDLLGGTGPIRIGVGSLLRGAIGGLFRKARNGAPSPSQTAVLLDGGRALDASTASRMGSAFGRDFSNVRIHTDAEAADTASRMSARAFTIGEDIAFANGEYRPGTIVGDALLAHELAHVVQQDGAEHIATKSESATGALEHDADNAAVHAVASLWPSVRNFARGLRANAMPRLKSSLQLQRCTRVQDLTVNRGDIGGFNQQADVNANGCTQDQRLNPIEGAGRGAEVRSCCTPKMIREIRDLYPEAIERVRNAIAMLDPSERGDFNDQLRDHFGIDSSATATVDTIRGNYRTLLALLQQTNVDAQAHIYCRSRQSDLLCGSEGGGRSYAETSCMPAGGPAIQICGDYEASLPSGRIPGEDQTGAGSAALRGRDAPFLFERRETSPRSEETYNGWVRTLIHEHVHALCNGMLPASSETYRGRPGYPSATPARNPDSYAHFAIDIGRVKRRTGTAPAESGDLGTARTTAEAMRTGHVPEGCPPTLGAFEMNILPRPTLLVSGDRCAFQLQGLAGARLDEGLQIYGTVGVASGCSGRLYWVQYVHARQMNTYCPGDRLMGLCTDSGGWGIDTQWPYRNASNHNLAEQSGSLRVWLGDIPGMYNISGAWNTRICIDHKFVSYLVYEAPGQAPTPLGWMSWRMAATAIRNGGGCPGIEGGGCTGWHLLPQSRSERTGSSRIAGAMHPDVALDRTARTILAGVGSVDCAPDSCPAGGLQP